MRSEVSSGPEVTVVSDESTRTCTTRHTLKERLKSPASHAKDACLL